MRHLEHSHNEISLALRRELKRQQRTIASVARDADLNYTTVERVCNGRSRGSPEVLGRILDALETGKSQNAAQR